MLEMNSEQNFRENSWFEKQVFYGSIMEKKKLCWWLLN